MKEKLTDKQMTTVKDFTKQMVKFWDEQKDYAYDYPSLDIWFKDGSYLKFFISVKEVFDIPFGSLTMAYAGDEGVIEYPRWCPALCKENYKNAIKFMLSNIAAQVDITKDVERIYRNVLTD